MMRPRACLGFLVVTLGWSETQAFVSSSALRDAFFRNSQTSFRMSPPTRQHDEWELPEEVQTSSSSSPLLSSASSSEQQMSETRRLRLEKEQALSQKFVTGDDLYRLREHAMNLRQELKQARQLGATHRVHELERAILKVQQVDAEFVYAVNMERMETAKQEGRDEEAEQFQEYAMEARSALPQFGLDGLWVGKYGDNCLEMINVTYVGDTLVAYKVTGHSTVPSGEVSFQADLSPFAHNLLEPIELQEQASQQWGVQYLPRFKGEGQVATPGFVNRQFVNGQLIMVNDYFSFAWIPLGHQVFFGRPSAELTLKMLKDVQAPQSELEQSRAHLERCMEETEFIQEELLDEDGSVYAPWQEDYYDMEGCFE